MKGSESVLDPHHRERSIPVPHRSERSDPVPHRSDMAIPDPYLSENLDPDPVPQHSFMYRTEFCRSALHGDFASFCWQKDNFLDVKVDTDAIFSVVKEVRPPVEHCFSYRGCRVTDAAKWENVIAGSVDGHTHELETFWRITHVFRLFFVYCTLLRLTIRRIYFWVSIGNLTYGVSLKINKNV